MCEFTPRVLHVVAVHASAERRQKSEQKGKSAPSRTHTQRETDLLAHGQPDPGVLCSQDFLPHAQRQPISCLFCEVSIGCTRVAGADTQARRKDHATGLSFCEVNPLKRKKTSKLAHGSSRTKKISGQGIIIRDHHSILTRSRPLSWTRVLAYEHGFEANLPGSAKLDKS